MGRTVWVGCGLITAGLAIACERRVQIVPAAHDDSDPDDTTTAAQAGGGGARGTSPTTGSTSTGLGSGGAGGTANVGGGTLVSGAVAYHIDALHSGRQVDIGLATPLSALWTVDLGEDVSYPLIANGRVFVTVRNAVEFGTKLHAFDAATGDPVWGPVEIPGTYFRSNAAYDQGRVFVVNFDGDLRAFDESDGTLLWSVALPDQYALFSPPTAVGGRVYLGGAGSAGTLYAVDGATGSVQWMETVWNGDGSSPAVSEGNVYTSYPCQFYAFSASSGNLLWHHNDGCNGGGGATPVLFGGRLWVRNGAFSTNLVLDAATGATLGEFEADRIPAFEGERGFFLHQGVLRSDDLATNATLWSATGNGSLSSAPIVVDGNVYVGSTSGDVQAFDVTTGEMVWSAAVGAPILAPVDTDSSAPLTGLAAGEGILVVPATNRLVAYH